MFLQHVRTCSKELQGPPDCTDNVPNSLGFLRLPNQTRDLLNGLSFEILNTSVLNKLGSVCNSFSIGCSHLEPKGATARGAVGKERS